MRHGIRNKICMENFGWETSREENSRRMKYACTDNIGMNLREILICGMGETASERDPVVGFCDHCNEF
jgi:hypothetical protein